jgi:hypothetical protein
MESRSSSISQHYSSRRSSSVSSLNVTAIQARNASIEGIFYKYDIARVRTLEKKTR